MLDTIYLDEGFAGAVIMTAQPKDIVDYLSKAPKDTFLRLTVFSSVLNKTVSAGKYREEFTGKDFIVAQSDGEVVHHGTPEEIRSRLVTSSPNYTDLWSVYHQESGMVLTVPHYLGITDPPGMPKHSVMIHTAEGSDDRMRSIARQEVRGLVEFIKNLCAEEMDQVPVESSKHDFFRHLHAVADIHSWEGEKK